MVFSVRTAAMLGLILAKNLVFDSFHLSLTLNIKRGFKLLGSILPLSASFLLDQNICRCFYLSIYLFYLPLSIYQIYSFFLYNHPVYISLFFMISLSLFLSLSLYLILYLVRPVFLLVPPYLHPPSQR